ncbi:MAG: Oligopeptide transporter [Gammaproteobacteria bacterium]|jgi:putative OPT family oligopeptide transporter|nr:Oligopeptide transporter [Gammaproteobacteria bacterium]
MNKPSISFDEPTIKPDVSLPEITFKAVVLAIIITLILAASNAYLALKLGQTIAASIPAAVIAMGALRFFKRHNILENNIVQTAASAGEGVAAAVSFVLPALVMTGYWHHFHYWQTALMTIIGGCMGVLFSIPLRRVMLNYPSLSFPEGTAIGNVLRASVNSGKAGLKPLLQGGFTGGVVVLFQTGFKFFAESIPLWTGNAKLIFGLSFGFSPALLGAGFIVGMQACAGILVGLILAWIIGMPILTFIYGLPNDASTYYDMAMTMRSEHIRYIGVGTMLLGGLWTLFSLAKPIISGIATSFRSIKATKASNLKPLRTERDIGMNYVVMGIVLTTIAAFLMYFHYFNFDGLALTGFQHHGITSLAVIFVLCIGFFMASICAYMTGLVGMTNNPLSGLMLGSTLLASLVVLLVLGSKIQEDAPETISAAVAIVLSITVLVAIIASISGENMQDLKAGKMVGATPWKQQVMLLVGVFVSALVIGPVLELLFQAYGIGNVYPRPGMDPAQMLPAPQAGLITTIAQGTLGHSLPYHDIFIGAGIAFLAIIVDEILKKKDRRLPVLAIGIGIYLPPDITTIVIMGGFINYMCKVVLTRRHKGDPDIKQHIDHYFEQSTLIACGLVAGAALMGVILAIPFVLEGSSDALQLVPESFVPIATGLGLIVTALICIWLYRKTITTYK